MRIWEKKAKNVSFHKDIANIFHNVILIISIFHHVIILIVIFRTSSIYPVINIIQKIPESKCCLQAWVNSKPFTLSPVIQQICRVSIDIEVTSVINLTQGARPRWRFVYQIYPTAIDTLVLLVKLECL